MIRGMVSYLINNSTLFISFSTMMYYSYVWVTSILSLLYLIDALMIKKTNYKPCCMRFVSHVGRDVRNNVIRMYYVKLSWLNALNVMVCEILRVLCERNNVIFPYTLVWIAIAGTVVFNIINLIGFCRKYRVIPQYFMKFIPMGYRNKV